MKTKKSLLSILALAIVFITSAVDKPKTNVQLLNSDQLLVTIQTENASKMEVTINNEKGNIEITDDYKQWLQDKVKEFRNQTLWLYNESLEKMRDLDTDEKDWSYYGI